MKLKDVVQLPPQQIRSVNVSHKTGSDGLEGYVVTPRAVDTLVRITQSFNDAKHGRSYSLVGPYGSGKSSLAKFISLLLSGDKKVKQDALSKLKTSNAKAYEKVASVVSRPRTSSVVSVSVVADYEPVIASIRRAMAECLIEFKPVGIPAKLARVIKNRNATSSEILEFVALFLEHKSLFLVVDELGKNLEAFRDGLERADLFILQQLAELANSNTKYPFIFLTMQHMAFADYAIAAGENGRVELAKIQGRFNEIGFQSSSEEVLELASNLIPKIEKKKQSVVSDIWEKTITLLGNVDERISLSFTGHSACYPIHPLVFLVLPELCARFGQNERTLVGFLTGDEEYGIRQFLEQGEWPKEGKPPIYRLSNIYDYFVQNGSSIVSVSDLGSRWMQIQARIRDVAGLTPFEEHVLKTIGVLNLISAGGTVRASKEVVSIAIFDSNFKKSDRADLDAAIALLEEKGIVAYREFADEFRLWEGTDFPLAERIANATSEISVLPIPQVLSRTVPTQHLVASRASYEHGTMRIFGVVTTSLEHSSESDLQLLLAVMDNDQIDGLVILNTEEMSSVPSEFSKLVKPVVVICASASEAVREASYRVLALQMVLTDAELSGADRVAKRELSERLQISQSILSRVILDTWSIQKCDYQLFLSGRKTLMAKELTSLSQVVSEAAVKAYKKSPKIKNETIARHELSAQGAKARRLLAMALIENPNKERFGLSGFGPEVAIYESFFKDAGFHRKNEGEYRLLPPTEKSWKVIWEVTDSFQKLATKERVGISRLQSLLMKPPVGLKSGLISLIIVIWLEIHRDTVLLYEHGTLIPQLDDATVERLLRNPDHFSVRDVGSAGKRGGDFAVEVGKVLKVEFPEPSLVDDIKKMFTTLKQLPEFAMTTNTLVTKQAIGLRNALRYTNEVDELLFIQVPSILDLAQIKPESSLSKAELKKYCDGLAGMMDSLTSAYQNLLQEVRDTLARAFRVSGDMQSIREQVVRELTILDDKSIGKDLKPLLLAIRVPVTQRNHQQWLENVAMVVTGATPKAWGDETVEQFKLKIAEKSNELWRILAIRAEESLSQKARVQAEKDVKEFVSRMEKLVGTRNQAEDVIISMLGRGRLESAKISEK